MDISKKRNNKKPNNPYGFKLLRELNDNPCIALMVPGTLKELSFKTVQSRVSLTIN